MMKRLFAAAVILVAGVALVRTQSSTLAPSAKDADASKVEGLVTALSNVRATSFVDKTAGTGLDAPDVTISLKFDENKQERVKLTRHGADAYAQRDGDTGAAKIDASSLDTITKALEALK